MRGRDASRKLILEVQIVATIKDGFISTNAVLTKVACDSMDEPSFFLFDVVLGVG